MPYIGNTAADRFVASKAATQFSGDGSTTAFTLEHSVGSDEDILVSVDGVIQEPSVAYAVSNGTTLTFTAAPSTNSGNNIFVYYLFRTVATVDHPATSALTATSGTFSTDLTVSGAFTSQGIDDNADATAITIDSSENVMVGKTSTNFQTVGVEAKTNGSLHATADQNNPMIAVRKTNDGKIIAFYKDATEVGNIQSRAGAVSTIVLDSSSTGGGISGGGGALYPTDHAGTLSNGALTLGDASYRWNNLYLAGSVFLGGTGSSNALDDYEEGTWTPTFTNKNNSATTATYTKVGNFVTCTFDLQANGTNTDVNITGAPFAMLVGAGQRGGGLATYQNRNSTEVWTVIPVSSTAINLYHGAASRTITGSETVIGTFSFFTTS